MMNMELTINNLQSLCRICLGDGELNVWKHTIKLPPSAADAELENEYTSDEARLLPYEEELTVHELLHIFEMWEHKILEIPEMELICHACLNECLNCYIFYKKLEIANRQVKQLFKAALEIEGDQESEQEWRATIATSASAAAQDLETVNESIKAENDHGEPDAYSSVDYKEFHSEYETLANNLTESAAAAPITHRPTENAKFVPTDGLTKLLGHVEVPATSLKRHHDNSCKLHAQKRPRYSALECGMSPTSRASTHRDASLVVGHFVPSCTDGSSAHNKLLTIDYGPVEIKGTHIHQISTSNVSLPLPASTVSVSTSASPSSIVEPVYKCKYCPQAFSALHYLMTHVRKTHVCLFCTRAFTNQNELHEHTKQAHQEHKCAICSKELSNHSSLRAHIKRIHGIKLPAQVALLDYRLTESNTDGVGEVQEDDIEFVATEDSDAVALEEAEAATSLVGISDDYMQIGDTDSNDPSTPYLLSLSCA